MPTKISAPRGTQDVLPDMSAAWQWLEGVLRDVAHRFSYREIRFPTFEHTELFLRGVGDTTDVVQKEMYTFEDKGGRSITLRPEGTASVVRAFVEHALYTGPLPLKVYYIAPNFRYEKPQAGRLREHHQFGVECFGSASPIADAEVIGLARDYIRALGLKGLTLRVNSIGCPVCRPVYNKALSDFFKAHSGDLCHTCLDRLTRNPLRILDCKSATCAAVAEAAPVVTDIICEDCRNHQEGLETHLGALDISFVTDPRLVRGLDYYTRTVFEFVSEDIGAQGTVCGGGRYDRLVETLGGPPTPALGFGSGMERLLMVCKAQGATIPTAERCRIFVATRGARAEAFATTLVRALRDGGLAVERDLLGRSLKAQMKAADRMGAVWTLVLGDEELDSGKGVLKRMDGDEDAACSLDPACIAGFVGGDASRDL